MKEIRAALMARLEEKTSWGRNDLIAAINEICIDKLSERVAPTTMTIQALGEPSRTVAMDVRPLDTYTYSAEDNFCRVFRLPASYPSDFCFNGGHPVPFLMVDWFNPINPINVASVVRKTISHSTLVEILVPYLRAKPYFNERFQYLVLCDFGAALVFGGIKEMIMNHHIAYMKGK